jgi:hypothetical protein
MFLDEYVACRPTKNVYKLAITQVSDTEVTPYPKMACYQVGRYMQNECGVCG